MPKISKHKDMMIHRDYAFSNVGQYDLATDMRRKFYIAGEWWADQADKERKKNKPKPEFHTQFRPINRIYGTINDMELKATIIPNSVEADDEGADLMQKKWRNDSLNSRGVQANENATREMVICGFGAVKVVAKYADEESPNPDEQYLCIEPIYDASSCIRFGVEAIEPDKSDAKRAWHLIKGDRKAFEKQFNVKEIVSFPNESDLYGTFTFDQRNDCYLAHYYEVVETKITEYDFSPVSDLKVTSGDGIKGDNGKKYTRDELSEMISRYEEIVGEKPSQTQKNVKCVMYALADGKQYLIKPQKMPFKRIPIIPRYAYHSIIDGEEYFFGELAKSLDPEMFLNYYGSALMEVMAADQLEKSEYLPEQIQSHMSKRASQHKENYPVLLSDPVYDAQDNIVHMGPIGKYTPPQVGSGLLSAGQFLTERLNANSAMGQASTPANVSGEAIQNVNERTDDALLPIVKSCLHAERAACETWIDAATSLYFSNPTRIRIMGIDGKHEMVNTLEIAVNSQGEYGKFGNNPRGRYTVKVEQGEAYKDQRQAARESVLEMLQLAGTDTEYGQMLLMKASTLMDGEDTGDLRIIARYNMIDKMIINGYPFEPENDEEAEYVQRKSMEIKQAQMQAQQQQQEMMMQTIGAEARAREMEGQAAIMNERNDAVKNQIDMHKAETDRMSVMIDAEKVGADISIKRFDSQMKAMGMMRNAQSMRM